MKMIMRQVGLALIAVVLAAPLVPALGTTSFTYQGRLTDNNQPANGAYDFKFILFNVPEYGSPVGPVLTNNDLAVVDGVFTALLDFGAEPFDGTAYWLEIAVRPGTASGSFTTLQPRQPLSPAPYALHAAKATTAATATSIADGTVTSSKLAASAVTSDKIADGTIGTAHLANGAVTSAKLAADAVSTEKIAYGAVGTAELANGAVTGQKLAAGVAPKFISLDVLGMFLDGAATVHTGYGTNSGIRLPTGPATSSFATAFTVPPDFTAGTRLRIHTLWHTSSTLGRIYFAPSYLSVARPGRKHQEGIGMAVVGGNMLTPPATAYQVAESVVELTPTSTNLAPGDSVHFGLFRGGSSDTNPGMMVLHSVWVGYE